MSNKVETSWNVVGNVRGAHFDILDYQFLLKFITIKPKFNFIKIRLN